MRPHYNWFEVDRIIRQALMEDMPNGDVSTACVVTGPVTARARLTAKAQGVVAGLDVAARVFSTLDRDVKIRFLAQDGDTVTPGEDLMEITGDGGAMLSAERTALNLLQRMSGIATAVRGFVDALSGFPVRITDTRKTAPGLRTLDKAAVLIGGGRNHRFSLSDGVMLKDNHIALAGGIEKAVRMARERIPHTMTIEVETKTLQQVEEALNSGADIIMLDNMSPEEMAQAVKLAKGRAIIEASGNMTVQRALQAAMAGVDVISVGSLTHSATALDISMNITEIMQGNP
ncbi:carboxylating nicotinate-nucleotide diphosphorylase [Thermanaerovibrio velox]|uniref:carboxylating nicotinate-nucleotide diphosphorylase n=1 Tax=Thermanaerovibrio velox TaxID=108007 RepID=UPI001FE074A3|nr:carboxylating nicotinate-nucleotide diphosphorylase [Thermanaerovibrio velox]